MGTEVLRPQDCIREAPPIFKHRKFNRKPVRSVKPENRRKSPATEDELRSRNSKIVLGQVTILRRGEPLDKKVKASDKKEITVYGTDRLGPETKQVRFELPDTYAGSAFFTSPSPSSLPLPSFFRKDCVKAVDDLVATRDLRRLLGLD